MQTPPSLDASVQRIKDAAGKFRRFKLAEYADGRFEGELKIVPD
jgi:hypothetical protein